MIWLSLLIADQFFQSKAAFLPLSPKKKLKKSHVTPRVSSIPLICLLTTASLLELSFLKFKALSQACHCAATHDSQEPNTEALSPSMCIISIVRCMFEYKQRNVKLCASAFVLCSLNENHMTLHNVPSFCTNLIRLIRVFVLLFKRSQTEAARNAIFQQNSNSSFTSLLWFNHCDTHCAKDNGGTVIDKCPIYLTPLPFSTPLQRHIYTQSQEFHNHRVTYSSEAPVVSSALLFRPLFTRGNVFICEGRGGVQRRKRKKAREPVSKQNKIARERKGTETSAICEPGSKPNHCPQSWGPCLTASFCNGSPALLPQTTGLWNHTQKHSSHQGQMHPYGHK